MDPGCAERNTHHQRRLLDGQPMKEHQVQHFPLADSQLLEGVPHSGATFFRVYCLVRTGDVVAGRRRQEQTPQRRFSEPSTTTRLCSHRSDDGEEPGLEGGTPRESSAPLEHPHVGGMEHFLGLCCVPPTAGQSPGKGRRVKLGNLLLEVCGLHGLWPSDTYIRGFAKTQADGSPSVPPSPVLVSTRAKTRSKLVFQHSVNWAPHPPSA